jgi:hypothetical protein
MIAPLGMKVEGLRIERIRIVERQYAEFAINFWVEPIEEGRLRVGVEACSECFREEAARVILEDTLEVASSVRPSVPTSARHLPHR